MAGPRTLINQKWDTAFDYSTEAFNTALKAIDDISNFIIKLKAINVEIGLPSFADRPPIQVPNDYLDSAPTKDQELGLESIESRGSVGDVGVEPYGPVNHPLGDIETVSQRIQGVPYRGVVIPNFDAVLEELNDVPNNPDAPNIGDIGDVPTFDPVDFPIPPTLDIDQVFNGIRPEDIPQINSLVHPFNYVEEEYKWAYKDTIDQVVDEWLGKPEDWYTIPSQYEQAIFERDKNRAYLEKEQAVRNQMVQYSQRGFSIPDGQLNIILANLERELNNTLSDRSREIAFEQAKLALDNAKQSFSLAIQYEQLLVAQDNEAKNRILEANKFASEFSLSVIKSYIDWYNAQVQLYLADIQVYLGLLEGEKIKLDLYKTELEAVSLQVQINQQTLDLYMASIDAYIKQVDLYKAQIEANSLIIEQNKLLIEQFATQVDAWITQIDGAAKTLDVNNQEINQQTWKEAGVSMLAEDSIKRINAYSASEQNTKSQVDSQVALMEGSLKEFESKNTNILKTIEADMAKIQQEAAAITSQVQANSYLLSKADTQNKYLLAYDELESKNVLETARIDLEQAKYNLDFALAEYELALKALTSTGEIASNVASASLSAVSASAGMSSSDGFSASSSQSWSFGDDNTLSKFPIIQPS